jgi:hypothetical protein
VHYAYQFGCGLSQKKCIKIHLTLENYPDSGGVHLEYMGQGKVPSSGGQLSMLVHHGSSLALVSGGCPLALLHGEQSPSLCGGPSSALVSAWVVIVVGGW